MDPATTAIGAWQDLATAPPEESCPASAFGEGSSAKAAKCTLAVVQRFVALQQIHMVRAAQCFRFSWTISEKAVCIVMFTSCYEDPSTFVSSFETRLTYDSETLLF